MNLELEQAPVLVVGAGIMGAGITQLAALAGHRVALFDNHPGAAAAAKAGLSATFDKLVTKGKLDAKACAQALQGIEPLDSLDNTGQARLVIEAIVEDLDSKRALFRQLEDIVADDCVLASNTSSISINALANGLRRPERLVGMHFFNPPALMRLVEVVSGIHSDCRVAEAIQHLAESWGKVAVHARSTPGFIVNRIARPFYAESLALLQERAATPETLDACLRGAGFRMGPCELMDLIGHDTNFAVTCSVYAANFQDRRYAPSMQQQALVEAGLLGRKSGRGFYRHPAHEKAPVVQAEVMERLPSTSALGVHGDTAVSHWIVKCLDHYGARYQRVPDSDWSGLQVADAQLRQTTGACASAIGKDIVLFDLPLEHSVDDDSTRTLAWAHSAQATPAWIDAAPHWLRAFGLHPIQVVDTPGLIVARTVAMLINEAADAVQQGVCSERDADLAMKLGVNYPAGPFEWLDSWNLQEVITLLAALADFYRGERYRISPWLRQRAWQQA